MSYIFMVWSLPTDDMWFCVSLTSSAFHSPCLPFYVICLLLTVLVLLLVASILQWHHLQKIRQSSGMLKFSELTAMLKILDSFGRLYIKINSMVLKVAATLKRKQRDLCDCINNRLMSFQSRVDLPVFQCCH